MCCCVAVAMVRERSERMDVERNARSMQNRHERCGEARRSWHSDSMHVELGTVRNCARPLVPSLHSQALPLHLSSSLVRVV